MRRLLNAGYLSVYFAFCIYVEDRFAARFAHRFARVSSLLVAAAEARSISARMIGQARWEIIICTNARVIERSRVLGILSERHSPKFAEHLTAFRIYPRARRGGQEWTRRAPEINGAH